MKLDIHFNFEINAFANEIEQRPIAIFEFLSQFCQFLKMSASNHRDTDETLSPAVGCWESVNKQVNSKKATF